MSKKVTKPGHQNPAPAPASVQLKIVEQPIDALRLYANNARTHDEPQIRAIAQSIARFGFVNPVIVDGSNRLIAGHGRYQAAKTLGLRIVPTIRLDHMTKAEKHAYIIADNQLAARAGWDRGKLAIEFAEIAQLDPDFDMTLTGFDLPQIELTLDVAAGLSRADEGSVALPPMTGPATCRMGDRWQLGDHALVCGDATQWAGYKLLMGSERAQIVFTDVPYNVPMAGHATGMGKTRHREFVQASGEMTDAEFALFLANSLGAMARASTNGSLHYVCIDWRGLSLLINATAGIFAELKNICVWVKRSPGMGSLYRSQHEFVVVFKNGTRAHRNNIELGRHGRSRSNVWNYLSETRAEDLKMHPTVKPVDMVADAIMDATDRGEIVLDGFGGSGTTLLAAEKTGRVARLIELDPLYCDLIIRRFEAQTGIAAVHSATGASFRDLMEQRAGKAEHD